MRYELTDFERAAIRSLLPNKPRGIPPVDDRRVLNGILGLRSGAPWRDLPETYGPRATRYNRFVRRRQAGVWDRIMDALAAGQDAAVQMTLTGSERSSDNKARGPTISPKRIRKEPICFSPYLHRARNLVERFFNKIKQCRRIATRYDKLAANYLAFVKLAAIRIWLRAYESTP
jgi:transposase